MPAAVSDSDDASWADRCSERSEAVKKVEERVLEVLLRADESELEVVSYAEDALSEILVSKSEVAVRTPGVS